MKKETAQLEKEPNKIFQDHQEYMLSFYKKQMQAKDEQLRVVNEHFQKNIEIMQKLVDTRNTLIDQKAALTNELHFERLMMASICIKYDIDGVQLKEIFDEVKAKFYPKAEADQSKAEEPFEEPQLPLDTIQS